MFVPIIMTLDPTCELSWMWVFHKMASIGKGYRWPIVAQKEYFDGYKTFEVPPISRELFDVSLKTDGVLENIISIEIPEYIINNFIDRFPSQTDAYIKSFVEEWTELVDYLYTVLNETVLKEQRAIEGLILFKYYKCFEDLGKKLGVPTFYFELGPLRVPEYRNTFYWSKEGLMGNAGLDKRYAKFYEEYIENPVMVLEAKEILALFLHVDKLSYLDMPVSKDYEFGILGGYSVPIPSTFFNGITLPEELMLVRKLCSDDKIIIKTHPGDPLVAIPRFPNIEEVGVTSAQFIQKCRRIVCAGSNSTFEAALYGVPAYDLGWSQYSFISNSLKELKDIIPNSIMLSFVAFGCLAPLELLKDIDYIRKIILLSSETDIYKMNLEYYLRDYGLTYDELAKSENRLDMIIKARLQNRYEYLTLLPKGNLSPVAELQIELNNLEARLKSQIEKGEEKEQTFNKLSSEYTNLKETYKVLEEENNLLKTSNASMKTELQDLEYKCFEFEELYHRILESTIYRSTKPVRLFMDILKKYIGIK